MTGHIANQGSGGPCPGDCKTDTPPSTSARIAKASAERSGNAAGGSLPSKPDRCSRCKQKYNSDGHEKQVHWSRRAQAWLCLWCHFEAPDAEVSHG
jgi:hypothetical protein